MDLVLVPGSDEQRTLEELGRGMGMGDSHVRLTAVVFDLCRWGLTDSPGHCCHHC